MNQAAATFETYHHFIGFGLRNAEHRCDRAAQRVRIAGFDIAVKVQHVHLGTGFFLSITGFALGLLGFLFGLVFLFTGFLKSLAL